MSRWICFLAMLSALLLDADILQAVTSDLGGEQINSQVDKIRDVLFGPWMKGAITCGLGFGAIQATLFGSWKYLVAPIAIGALVAVSHSIIEAMVPVSAALTTAIGG